MWSLGAATWRCWILVFGVLIVGAASPRPLQAQGRLENPTPERLSFQSGIGVISGWRCDAGRIDIEIDGTTTLQAAYGTEREDTREECGDADNGFGLLWNWNLVGDGMHTVRALADGEEFGNATIMVATLGEEFLTGANGTSTINFDNRDVVIQWEESLQNFVIVGTSVSARIEDTESVFAIFENRDIPFSDGLFGDVESGILEFGSLTAPTVTTFQLSDVLEGSTVQGTVNGGSCIYGDFQASTFPEGSPLQDGGDPIPCPLCDFRVFSGNVPLGGEGPGILILDLDGQRTPETIANPAFSSDAIPVTVGIDEQGVVISIDGIPVRAIPVP